MPHGNDELYEKRIAELEATIAELREAAREAVDAVRFQKPEHERAAIDALASLLEQEKGDEV